MDNQGQVLQQLIVKADNLVAVVTKLLCQYPVSVIVIGDRTRSKAVKEALQSFGLPLQLVDENNSTVEGRNRYLKANTQGWAKLLPIGLRVPTQSFDDYVAVILAERYFQKTGQD